MKPETIKRGWDIAQKLSVIGFVVIVGFYVDTKIEVSNITDNKEDIIALEAIHETDKSILHKRVSKVSEKLDTALLKIQDLVTTLKFLEKEHP